MYYYQVNDTVCASLTPRAGYPEITGTVPDQVNRFLFERDIRRSRGAFQVNDPLLLLQEKEGAFWLSRTELEKEAERVCREKGIEKSACQEPPLLRAIEDKKLRAINTAYPDWENRLLEPFMNPAAGVKKRVHVLALGDVGSTMVTGLHLMGGSCISEIGICDIEEKNIRRWEFEINQITEPWDYDAMPAVCTVSREELFHCDVFIFTASAGIPPVDSGIKDVRMYQFEKNAKIVSEYARQARAGGFKGLFCVVSDPVDPLAKAVYLASNTDDNGVFDGKGLLPEQIQSYGLGVMNARAAYYAKKDDRFRSFLSEGAAFGPHGQDLVIANSVGAYDDALSVELTDLVVHANLKMRELGFKPFVAPAYSSAALSIRRAVSGAWNCSGVFLGGVYMGCRNHYTENGQETELFDLPEKLFARIRYAEDALHAVN